MKFSDSTLIHAGYIRKVYSYLLLLLYWYGLPQGLSEPIRYLLCCIKMWKCFCFSSHTHKHCSRCGVTPATSKQSIQNSDNKTKLSHRKDILYQKLISTYCSQHVDVVRSSASQGQGSPDHTHTYYLNLHLICIHKLQLQHNVSTKKNQNVAVILSQNSPWTNIA